MSKQVMVGREIKRVPDLHKGQPLWESPFAKVGRTIKTKDPKEAKILMKQVMRTESKKSQDPAFVQKKVEEKNALYKKQLD